MIQGVGVDIVDVRRIERLLGRYGRAFEGRVFTEAEIGYCRRMARPAVHFSGRFAAKEAFYKALPESCQALATWRGVETLAGPGGRPRIAVVAPRLAAALSEVGVDRVHVSISHERENCVAIVFMEGAR
jgi:holo-[acyl-carrier protein] synthase